jgi:hypothetical protein
MSTGYSITVTRCLLVFFAIVAFALGAVLTVWLNGMNDEPAPELQQIAGTLIEYELNPSGKDQRTTVFAVSGQAGRFSTRALHHDEVTARWKPTKTKLTFSIQTNRTYKSMNGDGIKTFGLMEDGREIQSVSKALDQEEGSRIVARGLSIVVFGLGIALLVSAVRVREPTARASEA